MAHWKSKPSYVFRRSAKEHDCALCGELIHKGFHYIDVRIKEYNSKSKSYFDNTIERLHLGCLEARELISDTHG